RPPRFLSARGAPRRPRCSPTRRSSDLAVAARLAQQPAEPLAASAFFRGQGSAHHATHSNTGIVIGMVELKTPASIDAMHETGQRSEEHTSELQSRENLVCRLLLEKKKS